jgi:hypothetical protein
MAKSAGDKITELDYNTLQSNIAVIMGTPAGTTDTTATGYNQALSSAQVSVGNTVTTAQWDNLRSDITKAYTHQFGTAPTITDVTTSTTVDAATYNQYESLITTVSGDPNRYTLGSGQFSTVTGQTAQLSAGWNGTQTHQFTATFASSNERRAFFNAGGSIKFTMSLAYTGSEAKTLDWQLIMSSLNTIVFNYKETRRETPSALFTTIGNYDATGTFQQIAASLGNTPYSENDLSIQVRSNSSSQLEFRIILRDDDVGDRPVPSPPPPYGPLVDENVQGTTTSTVTIIKPNGANVSVPAPTIAAAAGNTFTVV